jgi:hypothetical protein
MDGSKEISLQAKVLHLGPSIILICLLSILSLAGNGCSSRPDAIKTVDVNPSSASQAAFAAYDTNNDGLLDDQELNRVPGIAKYKSLYDLDNNGSVSQDEVFARLDLWKSQGLGFRSLVIGVTMDGRPLVGAHIKLVPEPYLGEAVHMAVGETDSSGEATMATDLEHLPPRLAERGIAGVTGGTYKIEVTHPSKNIPARYNTATTIGEEVASDTIETTAHIKLTKK